MIIVTQQVALENNMNPITETINETMYSDNPSARNIIAKKLVRMNKYPSPALALELEQLGIVCDYQDSDMGNDPRELTD